MHKQKDELDGFTFATYPTFTDIKNPVLRAYNRCITARTIVDYHGKKLAKEYLEQFDEEGAQQLLEMSLFIKNKGWEEALREVQKSGTD